MLPAGIPCIRTGQCLHWAELNFLQTAILPKIIDVLSGGRRSMKLRRRLANFKRSRCKNVSPSGESCLVSAYDFRWQLDRRGQFVDRKSGLRNFNMSRKYRSADRKSRKRIERLMRRKKELITEITSLENRRSDIQFCSK